MTEINKLHELVMIGNLKGTKETGRTAQIK